MHVLQNNQNEFESPLTAPCAKCGNEDGHLWQRIEESHAAFVHLCDKCADNSSDSLELVQTFKIGKNLVTVAHTSKTTKKDVEAFLNTPDDE